MAISPADPTVLMLEGIRRPFAGDLLTLGRQQVMASREHVLRQAKRVGHSIDRRALGSGSAGLSDEAFFRSLGFSTVSSLDASDYEEATFIHDLNQAQVPKEFEERFDVVLDRGTSEHVFHLPNLLRAVGKMVKPGGRVIHFVPSSNHIDHGFYMFSPTLFLDYYSANGFELPALWLVAQPWLRARPTVEIFEYYPGCLEPICHGGLDDRAYQIFCVAVRTASAQGGVVPQQGRYEKEWGSRIHGGGRVATSGRWRQAVAPYIRAFRATRVGDALVATLLNPLKKRFYFRRGPRLLLRHQV